jgi:DNA-binding response OmpR family regulator/sugar-specific transcriptional regulator TrmB
VTVVTHSHRLSQFKTHKSVQEVKKIGPITNQTTPAILVVDDDKNVTETLTAILQSEGYATASAASAKETLEKITTRFFDLVLLDINLPDRKGTQLLSALRKVTPETIRIMITGCPSLKTATDAINHGADLYLTKPLDPDYLLKAIRTELVEREQKEITGEKMVEWARQRARKTQTEDIQELSEKMATEFSVYGVTKTQAKIYIGLCSLGIASAAEIANFSKIRREEVYRTLPELEKRGLVTRRFGAPKKFSATEPDAALNILAKTRLEALRNESDALEQKKDGLVSQLERIALRTGEDEPSIKALSQQEAVLIKSVHMVKKARNQLNAADSFDNLEKTLFEQWGRIGDNSQFKVKGQIVVEKLDGPELVRLSKMGKYLNKQLELRQVETLPFSLLMIDGKEAIWGEPHPEGENMQILWTNSQTHIVVLTMAFEKLWEKSRTLP